MSKKIIISMAVILLVVAMSLGSTMAWFTDSVELENTFTAGTLDIDGSDYWVGYEPGDIWDNVNPGDCRDKKITITNEGSKNALIRFQWDGSWGDIIEGEWTDWAAGDVGLVEVTAPDGWTFHDGWYYYDDNPLAPGSDPFEFTLKVCVDGPGTDNDYQGKSFKIDFTFEAVQASNNASGDEWGIDSLYDPADDEAAENWDGFDFGGTL